jgi:hypothetical protein
MSTVFRKNTENTENTENKNSVALMLSVVDLSPCLPVLIRGYIIKNGA